MSLDSGCLLSCAAYQPNWPAGARLECCVDHAGKCVLYSIKSIEEDAGVESIAFVCGAPLPPGMSGCDKECRILR